MAEYTWKPESETISCESNNGKQSIEIKTSGFLTPASEFGKFVGDVLGGFRIVTGILYRIPPRRHPLIPWCRAYNVSSAHFEQGQVASGHPAGEAGLDRVILPTISTLGDGQLKVTVAYRLPTLEESTITNNIANSEASAHQEMSVASEEWSMGGRELTRPGYYHTFSHLGPFRREEDAVITSWIPEGEVALTRHHCIQIPIITVGWLLNCVNENTMTIVNHKVGPKQARLDSWKATRKITAGQGFQFYEMTCKWALRMQMGKVATSTILDSLGGLDTTTFDGYKIAPGGKFITWKYMPLNWHHIYNGEYDLWDTVDPPVYLTDGLTFMRDPATGDQLEGAALPVNPVTMLALFHPRSK